MSNPAGGTLIVKHGGAGWAYSERGCRCGECVEAWNARHRDFAAHGIPRIEQVMTANLT